MKFSSKNSIFTILNLLFFIYIFISLFLFTSCGLNKKGVRNSQDAGGQNHYNGNLKNKNALSNNQSVEQRLEKIELRLKTIEESLGLNEADSSEDNDGIKNKSHSDEPYYGGEHKSDEQSSFDDIFSSDINSESDINSNVNSGNSSNTSNSSSSLSTSSASSSSGKQKQNELKTSSISPEAIYSSARNLLLKNKFEDAEKEFKLIAANYPKHPLAVNAYYWMGECRYSLKDYKGAIDTFKELIEKYPNGRKVPDALLKTAYAYLSMNDQENGREYLKKVVIQFPFLPAGEKAEEKLKELQ